MKRFQISQEAYNLEAAHFGLLSSMKSLGKSVGNMLSGGSSKFKELQKRIESAKDQMALQRLTTEIASAFRQNKITHGEMQNLLKMQNNQSGKIGRQGGPQGLLSGHGHMR